MTDYREVRTSAHEQGREQRIATFKITQLIWLMLGILEGALALRFVFKLIGVNAANAFATLLYNVTGIFVAPFASLTGAPAAGGMVLEFSTFIAMVVYLLIGWVFERIVYVLFYRPRGPVSTRQTVVDEHTPQQGFSQVQTTTTQAPLDDSHVTVTQRTNTR